MKIQSVRGMNDIYDPQMTLWHKLESVLRKTTYSYGFSEIRTPIVEPTELFKRGVGADTDIVEKEMYTFEDRNGESLTLRPEGTAGVVRSINEQGLLNENPVLKLYYMGPMFRHERPQKGRYRQFYQFGVEFVGSHSPWSDVEVMALQAQVLKELGLTDWVQLRVSSVGCENCRPVYKKNLIEKLEQHRESLPEDVIKRMYTNPQRIFDHKSEAVQKIVAGLPVMMDQLCQECQDHHKGVEEGMRELGIAFVTDPKIVRGLDYYTRTAFEFVTDKLGAQATVCGGGRYNKLIQELGGPDVPGIGFGMGIERIILLLEQSAPADIDPFDAVLIYPDASGKNVCAKFCQQLREAGLRIEIDYHDRAMKAQIKKADKLKARFAVIIGGAEVQKGVAMVKDMSAHSQTEVPMSDLVSHLVRFAKRSV
jgi:histidyl-tRNA synthetase